MSDTRTDHGADIDRLRQHAEYQRSRRSSYGEPTVTISARTAAAMYETAAALLEVHDDTGISLDDWRGPRDLVEALIHKPITENGV